MLPEAVSISLPGQPAPVGSAEADPVGSRSGRTEGHPRVERAQVAVIG